MTILLWVWTDKSVQRCGGGCQRSSLCCRVVSILNSFSELFETSPWHSSQLFHSAVGFLFVHLSPPPVHILLFLASLPADHHLYSHWPHEFVAASFYHHYHCMWSCLFSGKGLRFSGLIGVAADTRVASLGRFSVGYSSGRNLHMCDLLKHCMVHAHTTVLVHWDILSPNLMQPFLEKWFVCQW